MTESDRQRSVREQYFDVLLDAVRRDHYPSVAMLDMLEQVAVGEEREMLAGVLLDKVAGDAFPSIPMLRRIEHLAAL